MGNFPIKYINHQTLNKDFDDCLFINVMEKKDIVILGTSIFGEEMEDIKFAKHNNKKIVIYGYDYLDSYSYIELCNHELLKGYDKVYFYEGGLKEWFQLNKIHGDMYYPIYIFV